MTEGPLTVEAVAYAGRRLEALYLVHLNKSAEEKAEAMGAFLGGLGGGEEVLVEVSDYLTNAGMDMDDQPTALYGLIFGLLVAQFHDD